MDKIRVIVIDDSFFMRQAISKILSGPDIEVIDTAKDGKEGFDKVIQFKPDVVTMDIEMPVMTGLESLKQIMATYPVPVIMVSTLTMEGADTTIEAFSLGAVDFITKKSAFKEMDSIKDELTSKVIAVGRNDSLKNQMTKLRLLKKMGRTIQVQQKSTTPISQTNDKDESKVSNYKKRPSIKDINIVFIGLSTGGPNALQSVIPILPSKIPVPILVVQHMPAYFTKSLADRLDNMSSLNVLEAKHGTILIPGKVYISPGGFHTTVDKFMKVSISEQPTNSLYKPSVDVTMKSLIDSFGKKVLGLMMTGMGSDGLESYKLLNSLGGYIIAQTPESCVVSGMPKSVINAGIADEVQGLEKIAHSIATCFNMTTISN